jgi:oxygen-independent coproporphyrinogen-3 oxidase
MGLRLREGVDLARIARLGETSVEALIHWPAAIRLQDQRLLVRDGDHLTVTEAGMLLLDAILPEIVNDAA